jgi:Family of unknown function (DUF6356)
MFERLFLAHPHSVGEGYAAHFRAASAFAGLLLLAAMACLIHAIFPSLFERTASRTVTRLHERMTKRTPSLEREEPPSFSHAARQV